MIGFDAKRGDTISVQDMSFASDARYGRMPAPGLAERVQKTVSDYSSLLRPVSLLVLFVLAYLFVLRPIQKQAWLQARRRSTSRSSPRWLRPADAEATGAWQ